MGFDIFPTAVAAAGGSMPDGPTYDGRDMLPVLAGESRGPLHESLFWGKGPGSGKWAVRHGDWKLVGGKELYNLKDDIGETRDLSAERPEVVKQLTQHFAHWRRSVDADAQGIVKGAW
jgi:arylsulfatase A-like enzyme